MALLLTKELTSLEETKHNAEPVSRTALTFLLYDPHETFTVAVLKIVLVLIPFFCCVTDITTAESSGVASPSASMWALGLGVRCSSEWCLAPHSRHVLVLGQLAIEWFLLRQLKHNLFLLTKAYLPGTYCPFRTTDEWRATYHRLHK